MREPYESDASFPFIKTADAYLWEGIACCRIGDYATAFKNLNAIRDARGLGRYDESEYNGMKDQLEEETANQDRWDKHAAITQLDSVQNGDLALIIDCGKDDFFLQVNKNFHEALDQRKINHDFIIRPGSHNGAYWNNSIDYQWIFFQKFFNGYRSPQQ